MSLYQYLIAMNNIIDDRWRETKKKIFPEDSMKSHIVNRSSIEGKTSRQMPYSDSNSNLLLADDLKRQIEDLQKSNHDLKRLLKEERQRYDALFQEFEDVMEKNSLIEKEYINLKYEHNKEIKELKKIIADKLSHQVQIYIEEFTFSTKEDKLVDGFKMKIQKFMERLTNLPQLVIKAQKYNKSHSKRTLQIIEPQLIQKSTLSNRLQVQSSLEPQTQQVQILPLIQKCQKSSSKQPLHQHSQNHEKEIMFEDEYYGQLQDFEAFEEKVMMRRNYELMRKNNRSSADIKRKKIFNSAVGAC